MNQSMDPNVWSALPSHLLERVLASLPSVSLLRFRSVCRRWNHLPLLPSFARLHALHSITASSSQSSLNRFVFHYLCDFEIKFLDGLSGTCLPISLPFLPPNVVLEASGGGLLLFSCRNEVTFRLVDAFLLCNPTTKEWRKLPPPTLRQVFEGVIDVNPRTLEYQVLVLERADDRPQIIWVFDSKKDCWEEKGKVWEDDAKHHQLCDLLLWSGKLYLADSRVYCKVMSIVMQEEAVREVWGWEDLWWCHCLAKYRDSLIMVGRKGEDVMEIWQLKEKPNREDPQWVVLDRVLVDAKMKPATAAVVGDLICFGNGLFDKRLAIYNLADGSWRRIPLPKFQPAKFEANFVRPFQFQASFAPVHL